MAVEKAGANPKDFIVVGLGPQQQQRALESKAIDAVMIDPPVLFVLQQKGFSKVLDIGSLVEMPVGGLTTLSKTIGGKPDQVRRAIKALQEAKETLVGSKEKSVEFIVKTMKWIDTAVKTFEIMAHAWAGNGVPTPVGMNTSSEEFNRRVASPSARLRLKKLPTGAWRSKLRGSWDIRNEKDKSEFRNPKAGPRIETNSNDRKHKTPNRLF